MKFDQIFTKVCDRLALYVCGGICLIMMFYVCSNVFSRYILKIGGVVGCYTFVGALLVPFVYLALSYAWYKRGYVAVDMIQVRMKGKVVWGFQFAFLLVTLLGFVVIILCGALLDIIHSYNLRAVIGEVGYIMIPLWPWQATIIIGTSLMAIRNILDMIRMMRTGEVIPADR